MEPSVIPRAKRFLPALGGALTAAALTVTGLATAAPAQAAPEWARDDLSAGKADAYATAGFWLGANGAALKKASQYNWDAKAVTRLATSRGEGVADGKPGAVAPIGGEKTAAAKVKNVNLPKTVGKVFFVDHKGDHRWCSATSIQSTYRNLVATAGHCVYDVEGNRDVMDRWVFVPGYYQGKAPWGVYVGQAAFTHYNFAVHEDFDHDYAFVAVYNGFALSAPKEVTKGEFSAWTGSKWVEHEELKDVAGGKTAQQQYAEGFEKYGEAGPYWSKDFDVTPEKVGHDYKGAKTLTKVEVVESAYNAAAKSTASDVNGEQYTVEGPLAISKEEYDELGKKKAEGGFLGKLTYEGKSDAQTAWFKTQYYVKQWVKTGKTIKYFRDRYHVGQAKDTGRLGDAVGGQGFAWNQKTGQPVYAFGYPGDAHPDGDKPFTGVTMKYCYGKTNARTYASNAYKVEDHAALKCSMTGGADGGPWLIKYSSAKRLGYVNGVTSVFHDQDGNDRVDFVSSPYFDSDAAGAYRQALIVRNTRIVGDKGELLR
jgi:hypothetical protein